MTEIPSGLDSIHILNGSEGVTQSRHQDGKNLQAEAAIQDESEAQRPQPLVQVNALKDELNKIAEMAFHQLKFEVSEENNDAILIVVDARSGEVIRQIPEEKAITLKQMIAEGLAALNKKTGLLLETDI